MEDLLFKRGIKRLEAAFRTQPLNKESISVYYSKLSGFTDAEWGKAIEMAIENESYFPSIAVLIKFCNQGKPVIGRDMTKLIWEEMQKMEGVDADS